MSHLATVIKLILFLLIFSFAFKNGDPVQLRYYFGVEWQLPLSLALLCAFAAGLVIGLLVMSMKLMRMRREVSGLRKAQHGGNKKHFS